MQMQGPGSRSRTTESIKQQKQLETPAKNNRPIVLVVLVVFAVVSVVSAVVSIFLRLFWLFLLFWPAVVLGPEQQKQQKQPNSVVLDWLPGRAIQLRSLQSTA